MDRSCFFCEKISECNSCVQIDSINDCISVINESCTDKFTPNTDWLEYIKLLDDQIAFREKTVNDLYERDCKIESLKKENEELKEKVKTPKFAIIGSNGIECLDPICEHCQNVDKRQLVKENEELKRKIQSYKYERKNLHGYLAKCEVKE